MRTARWSDRRRYPQSDLAELFAGGSSLLEFIGARLSSGNEELTSDAQEGQPELGDNGKCSKCPCSRHIEGLPGGPSAVVLKARMHHLDVGEMEFGGGGRHPVKPAALRIDQRERRCWMGDGERQAGQSGT